MSINTHLKLQQSRRDDLESLFYVLLLMINRKIPWSRMNNNDILDKKSNDETYESIQSINILFKMN